MDNSGNSSKDETNNTNLLNVLTVELNDIMIKNEVALKKSAELRNLISDYEARRKYFSNALAEAEKIAKEINYNSCQRVEDIMTRAESTAEPQRKQILCLDQEIAELTRKISTNNPKEIKLEPKLKVINTGPEFPRLETDEAKAENIPKMTEGDSCEPANLKDQPIIIEEEPLNFGNLGTGDMLQDELFRELQNIRKTLIARQESEPEMSFKTKLGHIFKTGN